MLIYRAPQNSRDEYRADRVRLFFYRNLELSSIRMPIPCQLDTRNRDP
jgi:hypothetical protein